MKSYMYILKCSNGTYYTGCTIDLERRMEQHMRGEGTNYTRKHVPVKLIYYEEFMRVDEAWQREKQVRNWCQAKKDALIINEKENLHLFSRNYKIYGQPLTFSRKIIDFNMSLEYNRKLPESIRIMNPFRENPFAFNTSADFYEKFYNDFNPRILILGINPGRFGAGVTGIPFTDTKRLKEKCGLTWEGPETHETSSVFIYEMIDAYGGVNQFYGKYFINSVSPLGFVITGKQLREKNYNYYDSKKLMDAVEPFIIESLHKIMDMGINRDLCICLGNNKNYKYLIKLNDQFQFFQKIIPLEHPRYIMQYRSKEKDKFISKYLQVLRF